MAEKANEPVNKKQKTDEDIEEDGVEDCTKAADADLQAEKSPILGEDGKPLSKRALKRLAKRENFQKWKTEKRYGQIIEFVFSSLLLAAALLITICPV